MRKGVLYMTTPAVSLCMIVKDEAANVERCLNSVKGLVSEMLVVDTGSQDETVEICRQLGADVLFFPWCGDFAAARNYGLERAKGDWILWMDADEVLCIGDVEKALEYLQDASCPLLSVDMIHYYGAEPHSAARSYHMRTTRLIRNHLGLRFRGMIHEQLTLPQGKINWKEDSIPDIQIKHFGYMNEVVCARQKNERNLSLLVTQWNITQEPWTAYHIASEYYRGQKCDSAYGWINQCLSGFLSRGIKPPALAYKLKYELLLISSPDDHTLCGLELALKLYPDYVDLHYYRGLLLFSLNRFSESIECFIQCIELGEDCSHYLSLHGVGSFYAYYYLGLCYEALAELEKAQAAFRQATDLQPQQ